uniref:Neprosin PEP catalytic domain-containing protein n=1 Tax=Triticum urartu TaxID=4572 RepID=A0A8R7QKJ1_TRIUA
MVLDQALTRFKLAGIFIQSTMVTHVLTSISDGREMDMKKPDASTWIALVSYGQMELGLAPGDAIQPVSNVPHGHMQNITIRVLKERTSGDWWVYYGSNSVPTGVGRFPRSSFTYLADKANHFAFGGAVISHRADPTPPMGSGSFPNGGQGHAASFTNLRIIDENGNSKPITVDLPVLVTNNKCHSITPINHGECLYGGPGGCVR